MQERLAKVQAEVATKTVQASGGGGMVTVVANGAMEIVSVKIDPEVLKASDGEMLQDLVVAATNEALRKAREMVAEEMKGITGGSQFPGSSNVLSRWTGKAFSKILCGSSPACPGSAGRPPSAWPFTSSSSRLRTRNGWPEPSWPSRSG